jgi:tryptophan-rich sensory protein
VTGRRLGGWADIIVAVIAANAVAAAGGLLTDLGPWYQSLREPSWKPPDIAFGPIWTTIFLMAAIAGVLAWRSAPNAAARRRVLALFAVNGALNILWSLLFFHLRRPDLALDEVGALWLSILALIIVLAPRSRLAGLLLAPYLIWVGIASVLNYQVVALNGPFG